MATPANVDGARGASGRRLVVLTVVFLVAPWAQLLRSEPTGAELVFAAALTVLTVSLLALAHRRLVAPPEPSGA